MKKQITIALFAVAFLFSGIAAQAQVKKIKQTKVKTQVKEKKQPAEEKNQVADEKQPTEKKESMVSGKLALITADSLITVSRLTGNLPRVGQEAEVDNIMVGCGIAYIPVATIRVESIENDSVLTFRIIKHLPKTWGDDQLTVNEPLRISWTGPAGKKVGEGRNVWDF